MNREALETLDATGYEVLDALTHVKSPPTNTLATPHAFVAIDGKTYWVKAQSQRGLLNEMIGGRLAVAVGIGPAARVIRVPSEALPTDGSAAHLQGTNVGLEDIPATVNVKDLAAMGVTKLDPDKVSKADRALAVAFHSWTATNDPQVLLNLQSGRIHTIDFGDSFSDLSGDPSLVVVDLPGIGGEHGRSTMSDACARIEAVSDEQILNAVAKMPWGDGWGASSAGSCDKRLEIAERLAVRRSKVREVMQSW